MEYMLYRKTKDLQKYQANFIQLAKHKAKREKKRSMKALFQSQFLVKAFLTCLASFLLGRPCFHLITDGLIIDGLVISKAESINRDVAVSFSK